MSSDRMSEHCQDIGVEFTRNCDEFLAGCSPYCDRAIIASSCDEISRSHASTMDGRNPVVMDETVDRIRARAFFRILNLYNFNRQRSFIHSSSPQSLYLNTGGLN